MGLQPGGLITGRAYNRGDYNRDLTVIRLLKRIANIFWNIDSEVIGSKFSTGLCGFPAFWMAVIIHFTVSFG